MAQALTEVKLETASPSASNVSNTVSSFVMDSRSRMRLVRPSSFSVPPWRRTVAKVPTISPRPALSRYSTPERLRISLRRP